MHTSVIVDSSSESFPSIKVPKEETCKLVMMERLTLAAGDDSS